MLNPDEYESRVLKMAKAIHESRVLKMAKAIHEDCLLEWRAIAAVDPTRKVTQHGRNAHYEQSHALVRRIWPELDTTKEPK